MKTPVDTIENLALEMIGCVFDNDMSGLHQCLAHPDGPKAALWENSGALRTAVRKQHNHFLPILLPYTCEEDGGFALSLCLGEGEIAAFDVLMAYNSNFARHMEDNALGWLGGHYQRALEDDTGHKKDLVHRYAELLERVFESIPSDVIEWQLGVMAQRVNESETQAKSFALIEHLWSERNKQILEHTLDGIAATASPTRKI